MSCLAFVAPAALPSLLRRHTLRPPRRCRTSRAFMSAQAHRGLPAPVPLDADVDVRIVPILEDNFSYLIHHKPSNTATLVDPAEPQRLLSVARALDATVTTSLTTHHHWDHAGGNDELHGLLPDVDIVGSAHETIPSMSTPLSADDVHPINGGALSVRALRTPCHTSGHLCYVLHTQRARAVFTGDTLFVAGCGRFFEGSAEDMHLSLNTVLAALPDDTLVFCGHEYTVSNLVFARSVDPDNPDLTVKLNWAKSRVAEGLPTVPTSIAGEKAFNPFMRNHLPQVKAALGMPDADDVAVMKTLRERKNTFRPPAA